MLQEMGNPGQLASRFLLSRQLLVLLFTAALGACGGTDELPPPRGLAIQIFEVSPEHLTEAAEVTVQWRTLGAASLELLQGGQAIDLGDAPIAEGSIRVQLNETTTFTLIARSAGGEVLSADREVTVNAPLLAPRIARFSAPDAVQADEAGEATATLSWAGIEGASQLVLLAPGQTPIELDPIAAEGSRELSLREDTTFTLVATNEVGEASRNVTVRVLSLPAIDHFDAERRLVGFGESSVVHWSTTGANRIELWQDGLLLDGPRAPEDSQDLSFTSTSTLELRAYNELETMATANFDVEVGAPLILGFQLDSTSLWLDEATTFSWQTLGGSELTISLDGVGEILCEETEYEKIETSSCTWQPLIAGIFPLTLSVTNPSGVVTESAEVFAAGGPLITRFDAKPKILNAGDELAISWAVHSDPAGNEPTLRLVDDRGRVYETGGEDGLLTNLFEAGNYELQLEATTDHPGSLADQATVAILVHPLPVVTFEATPDHFDDSVVDEVRLSWTTQHAETVVLYRLVNGNPVQMLEAQGADRQEGSYRFVPDTEERFQLVATNLIGGATSQEIEVTLAPLEVLVVEADPDAFTQGQEVRLSWVTRMADEVTIDIGTRNYILEETTAPYLDLPGLGGTRVPLTSVCGAIDTQGCAQIAFPDGFTFPFGDAAQSGVLVYTPGYLSFSTGTPPAAVPANLAFPTARKDATISIAPFWDTLGWDLNRYPTGNIYTALLEEDAERIFVIQWRDIGHESTHWRTTSFNFEVVLREDGSFDFRYGNQSAENSGIPSQYLAGESATIGFQLPDQSDSGLFSFDGQPSTNGSRAKRTFSYRPFPTLPLIGELRFSPFGRSAVMPVTVTAKRGGASHSKTTNLAVSRKPLLDLIPEEIEPVLFGEEFRLGWRTSNATALVVVDQEGTIRCTAPNQVQIDEGVCAITEEVPGRHEYTVRATGANDFVAERKVEVDVFGAFGVATFTADATSIEKGDDVLLSWRVFEAASVSLYANDVEIHTDNSGAATGSFRVPNLGEETEFKLVVLNEFGVSDEATLSVSLWEITFGLQPSATSVHPGDPITVAYDARDLATGAPIQVYGVMPMGEVSAPGDLYSDITNLPQAVNLNINSASTAQMVIVPFPEGFAFPYMGETYTEVRAYIDGAISLRPVTSVPLSNVELPSTVSTNINVQFAPFWDDVHPRGVGKMHSAKIDDDTFVIQWSKMALNRGSSTTEFHDLNFQVVFHRDGSFDYRYGTMAPHPTRLDPVWCYPADCTNEVAGAAATIGYQSADGTKGHSFLFGGTNPGASNPSVFGGLTNRTFRYKAIRGTGSFTFRPDKTETFTFCTDRAGGPICRDLRIEVEFGLRSATLSKEEIGFGEGISVSWESVGGKLVRVYEGDSMVFSTSESAAVAQGATQRHPTQDTFYVVELLAGNLKQRVQRLVEIHRASMTASATASTGPGSPVILSWTPTRIDPAIDLHVAAPMVEIPNGNFYDYDLSYADGVQLLIGAGAEATNATLEFVDFTFPYFGTEHSTIQVATDGYLSWETGNSTAANAPIPTTISPNHTKAIAPFWEDLHTRQTGRILAKKIDADRYVIQWSGVSLRYGSSDTNQGELNFLVVLHRNGSFEFRYGPMRPPPLPGSATDCYPASCERESNGSSATIGYQAPGGVAGHQVYFGGANRHLSQMPVPGGLAFRGWKFTPQINAGPGSVQVHPADSTHYKICGYDPASGEATCAPTVGVDVPWGIDLFQVSPEAPMEGQQVTLSWSVRGLDSLRILANGNELAVQNAPNIQLMGNLLHTLSGTTTYTIEAGSLGRVLTEERVVAARAFDLTISAPTGTFFPGETIQVQWELNRHLPGDIAMLTPMSEIQIGSGGEGSFVDVSGIDGATELSVSNNGSTSITLPFPFPYLGTQQNVVEVFVDGYLSFAGMGGTGNGNNTMFPATRGTTTRVHLAPFWDDLLRRTGDSLWRYSPDPDTQIIQWKGFSRADSSSAADRYDLNFQVVLRKDGSFEYRYGTMAPPQMPFAHTACRPTSCINEANGSSATIGYQSVDAANGFTLHIGAPTVGTELAVPFTTASDGFLPFPGGLSHRSFRYTPASTGSARVVVGRTGDQEVCGILGDFKACKSVRIDVVASPGDLMITEVLIDPASGVPGQWLEIRNLTNRGIDLQGFSLRSTAGSHTIPVPLPVPPGGFVTLASSADVPFTPSYVYGDFVPLDRLNDTLELLAGNSVINSMSWGVGWHVPHDQVLSLDPSFHLTGIQDTPSFDKWCHAGSSGSPGSTGAGCIHSKYVVDPLSDRPFIDIALTGTRFFDAEVNNGMGRLPTTGFQAKLFGDTHTRFWVATNGWVSLSDTLPTSKPETVTQAFPRTPAQATELKGPLVAPFWNTLTPGDTSQVFYERKEIDGEDVLIVQWQGFRLGGADVPGSVTFQLQLWGSGDLVMAFGSLDIPHRVGSVEWAPFVGSDAWIGLESADPTVFITAHYKRKLGLEGRSILFSAR